MLEMGMTFSFGQLVIDDEIAAMVKRVVCGVGFDDDLMGVDLIKEIGIGGHFLAERHVMDHLATEQIQATVIDRRVREDWQADGAKSLRQVANQKAREILEYHEPEPLSDDMVAELKRIVKKAEDF
jgi:trimethylamine--corrinoid protein Co-methyltransferase